MPFIDLTKKEKLSRFEKLREKFEELYELWAYDEREGKKN